MARTLLGGNRGRQAEAVAAISGWTRQRFDLSEHAPLMVSEIVCGAPGCPPLETVVLFWDEDGTRYGFKIFKPLGEVVEADLPVAWLKPTLTDFGNEDCC